MWSILALGVAERSVNRLIDLDPIARLQLNELQGQLLRIKLDSPPLSLDVYFDHDKLRFEPTATGQQHNIFETRPFDEVAVQSATTTLHVEHLVALAKLILSQEQDLGNIPVQGDYRLLMQLKTILQNSELDFASYLTPYVGASMAHELGKMQQLPKMLWQQLQTQRYLVQDYIKEDSGLFAPRWQMDDIQQQTRQLNQEIDRLEAKVKKMQQQVQGDGE